MKDWKSPIVVGVLIIRGTMKMQTSGLSNNLQRAQSITRHSMRAHRKTVFRSIPSCPSPHLLGSFFFQYVFPRGRRGRGSENYKAVLLSLFDSCVTLDKSLHFPEPVHPGLNGDNSYLILSFVKYQSRQYRLSHMPEAQ